MHPNHNNHQQQQQQQRRASSSRMPSTTPARPSVLRAFVRGVLDSFALPTAFIVLYGSHSIRQAAFKCLVLNGLIFLGSILLFDRIIVPLATALIVVASTPAADDGRATPPGQLAPTAEPLAVKMASVFTSLYHILWVCPVFLISIVLNAGWYQIIADRSYQILSSPSSASSAEAASQNRPNQYASMIRRFGDETYRALLIFNYLLIMTLLSSTFSSVIGVIIPYYHRAFSTSVAFVLFTWISAFLAFEYRWNSKGWSLDKKIEFFEERWIYFGGFGLTSTLLTFFLPLFLSAGLYAVIFPMYIIMANRANPVPHGSVVGTPGSQSRLYIFFPSRTLTNWIIKSICGRGRTASTASSTKTTMNP